MVDDRDRRRPHTPAAGSPTLELARRTEERDRRDRSTGSLTPLENEMPLDTLSRGIRITRDDVRSVGDTIDKRVAALEGRMIKVETLQNETRSDVREILDEAKESKRERLAREERRARERLEREALESKERSDERTRKHERNMRVLTILVPTITALAAGIAAVIASYSASGH